MFNAARYRKTYERILGPLAQDVTLKKNNGTGFTSYSGVEAHVSKYRENDLIADGSIELGDLRLIVMAENLPVTSMDKGDRVEIDGRNYAVIHWDNYTRKMGSELVAVEVGVRG